MTEEKKEEGIELQDLSAVKSEALVLASSNTQKDPDDFYQAYWRHYQHYLFNSEAGILDLYKACENLLKSSFIGSTKAEADLHAIQKRFLSHDFSKAVDRELIVRLEAMREDDKHYFAAQNSLFVLYYTKRYSSFYSNYSERYHEIFQSLQKIQNAPKHLDPQLADFAAEFLGGYPDGISYESLKSSAWKILIYELLGEDPFLKTVQKHKDQSKKIINPGSPYPFQILSSPNFLTFLSTVMKSQPEFIAEATQCYSAFIQTHTVKLNCAKQKNGMYRIRISDEMLKQYQNSIIYFTQGDNDEVARFEIFDNQIYFQGHGDNIHLTIEGDLDYRAFHIENNEADVIFSANFNQTQSLYFSANVKKVTLDGDILSKKDIKFDVQGEINVATDTTLITEGPIDLRADSCNIDGKIESHAYFQSVTEGVTTIGHRGSCHGATGVSMTAKSLNKVLGEITTDQHLVLKIKDGVYIHGSAYLEGKESVTLNAKSLLITDKAKIKSDKAAQLHLEEIVIIDKQSHLQAESFQVKAKNIKNYSPNVSANKIAVHCEDTVENHPAGVFATTESLQFIGGSVWNGGKLKFGKKLDVKLNKVFVHGVASLKREDLMDAVKHSSIEGEDMHIIAGVVFGALGSTYVRNQQISAIAELGAGLSTAKYTRRSRLVSLECNIELPNILTIYKDLSEFCGAFQKGDYESVLKSLFSFETFTNVVTVARWMVRTLTPGLGKGIDLIWSVLILISSLPNLFHQCNALYQKSKLGHKIEYYELYQLISAAGGIGMQALNLEGQIESGIADGFSISLSNTNIADNIPSLSLSLASLFIPSTTDESLLGISSGVSANGALMRRNILSYQLWHTELGINITHTFEQSVQRNQVTLANNNSNIGHELYRSGRAIVKSDVANVDRLTDSSSVSADTITWLAEDMNENANLRAKSIIAKGSRSLFHQGNFSAEDFMQLSSARLEIAKQAHSSASNVAFNGATIINSGTAEAKRFIMTGKEYAESTNTSKTTAEIVYESAKVVKQNGHITVSPSDAVDTITTSPSPAESKSDEQSTPAPTPTPMNAKVILHGEESATVGAEAKINGATSNVAVMADTVTDEGQTEADGLFLIGTERATLSDSAKSTVHTIYATGKYVEQDSEIEVLNHDPSSLPAQPVSDAKDDRPPNVILKSENTTALGTHSNIHGKEAIVYAKSAHVTDAGIAEVKEVIVEATGAIDLAETAHTKSEKFFAHADTINQASTLEIKDVPHPKKEATPKNNEEKEEDSQNTPNVVFKANKDLGLSRTSHIQDVNGTTYLGGTNVKDDGTAVVDTLIEHADDHLETGESASHVASTLTSLQAATASLNGTETAPHVDYQVGHGLNIGQLIAQQQRQQTSEGLSFSTEDNFILNEDINTTIPIDITCSSVSANSKSIRDSKDFRIKTTQGGVSFEHCNVRSDGTFSINSASTLETTYSNISADILAVETQSDIRQKASMLHGDTYTQIIDHGKLTNAGELVNGPNGLMYLPSYIQGGSGVGFDGVGAYIVVGGVATNVGSYIESVGNLFFNPKKGLYNIAYQYSYTQPNSPPKITGPLNIKEMMLYMAAAFLQLPPTTVTVTASSFIRSSGNTTILLDEGDIRNTRSGIMGNEVYLQTPQGKIVNLAGLLQAYRYLEMITSGNIENLCIETDVRGKYSMQKIYEMGRILGGTGEGHDGNGLVAIAQGRLTNDASEISSSGNNFLSAKQGISSFGRYNEYISYYRHTRTWYGKENTTIDRSFQTQNAIIYSSNGSNRLTSEMGGIDSTATDFIAAEDNHLSAKGPIRLMGYVLTNKEYKDKSALWGLVDHQTHQSDEVAVPTVIVNPGNTVIESLSDVKLLNATVRTAGKVSIAAQNILFSAPVLNHTMISRSRGFGFNYPALNMTNFSPLYSDYQALKGSRCGQEWAANGWNMGFDSLTSANNIIAGMRSNSLGQTLFPTSSLTSGDLTYTRTKTTSRSQSVASNVDVECGELELTAVDVLSFANSVPIYVAGDAHIRTRLFAQTGAVLNGSVVSASQGVSVGLSLGSDYNVGVNASGSRSTSTTYANQIFQVGGSATIDCDQWSMTNANLLAGSLTDHSQVVSIVSYANTYSSRAWSVSANTNGCYSYQQSSNRSAIIGMASGITTTAGADITADKMYLQGGKISSGGASHIQIREIESESVAQYSEGHTYGSCGNVRDLMPSPLRSLWQPGISSVSTTLGRQNYQANQQATIFIPNSDGLQITTLMGQLNTATADGLIIDRDVHYNTAVKIPVATARGLQQMRDNFAWAEDKLIPHNFSQSTQITSPVARSNLPIDIDSNADVKQSRLKRWQNKDIDGLAGEESASKWSKLVFNDLPPLVDSEDNSQHANNLSGRSDLPATAEILENLPGEPEEFDFISGASPVEKALIYSAIAASTVVDGLAIVDVAAGIYRYGRAGLTLWRTAAEIAPESNRFFINSSDKLLERNNNINLLRLQRELTLEQASSIFTEDGMLMPEVIEGSRIVIPGNELRNSQLIDALTSRGGSLSDWGKYATKPLSSPSGNFEIHFYQNSLTGDVYYGKDYKAIFEHQGTWNAEPKPKFHNRQFSR